MSPFKVIIIGGGLSGSLLANGLIRHDVDVVVYERLERHVKREGYQIRMGANALAGFRACLSKEHIDGIISKFGKSGGRVSSAPVVYGSDFKPLLDFTKFPTYSKSAPINRVTLRDTLADPVYDAGRMHYNKEFDRYEITTENKGRELVRVWFKDGSSDTADVLIGADGSHSKINKQLGLNNIKAVKTHTNFVLKADLPTSKYLAMTPELHRTPVLTFLGNKSLYFCTYLPDRELGEEDQTKPAVKFDDTMSSCMFGLFLPTSTIPEGLTTKPAPEQWDFCQSSIKDWAPEYHEIMDLIKGSDFYAFTPRVGTEPSIDWRATIKNSQDEALGHPRVWLMGDAIHPMLPSRGMGGNQALRDTATLLPLLVELSQASESGKPPTTDTVAKRLRSYETEMIPRAFGWVKKSGGTSVVPFDSDRFYVRLGFLFVVAPLLIISNWVTKVLGFVRTKDVVDDAPEFKD
ncbi:FAD binding domain-containing protein [Fusarium phyllophilum]|uniref:FAD binding domain-containing protein n=1 Tax=Fusarium phyllophilum TaxID=47803 RepID=A0A8H5N736_9HYPO|nr:FAD binding domain-containing protein [Fusarium phyllophilum]